MNNPTKKQLFMWKFPQISSLFWDIPDPQKLLEDSPADFFTILNNRDDWLVFYLLTELEWQLIFRLETETGLIAPFASEKTLYHKGVYRMAKELEGKYWLQYQKDLKLKIENCERKFKENKRFYQQDKWSFLSET